MLEVASCINNSLHVLAGYYWMLFDSSCIHMFRDEQFVYMFTLSILKIVIEIKYVGIHFFVFLYVLFQKKYFLKYFF